MSQQQPVEGNNEDPNNAYSSLSPGQLAEQEKDLERKLVVFGEDLGSIPCFRNSFLYGITGGIGLGIGHFALSSKVRNATKFGFYSYVAITLSYWCACRYNYAVTKFQYTQIKYAMQQNAMKEGTAEDMSKVLKDHEQSNL
jgi:cytochrome c oxidase assembly protein subunit 20